MTGARVLLVDDDLDSSELVARVLDSRGHRTTRAGSAEEAEDALKRGRFDFVLLDVILPGRTGLQALATMTAATRAPIHMMSGQSAADVLPDATLLGAAGFFQKPLDLDAVLAAIAALPPSA